MPDAFVKKISCDNYSNPYGSLAVDGVPVIKKKIFSAQYFEEAKALDVLNFALDHYRYDLGTLLESVEQIYGLTIRQERVKVHIRGPVWTDGFLPLRKKKKEDIKQFIHDHGAVFIYGIGAAGRGIYQTFFSYENNPKLKIIAGNFFHKSIRHITCIHKAFIQTIFKGRAHPKIVLCIFL